MEFRYTTQQTHRYGEKFKPQENAVHPRYAYSDRVALPHSYDKLFSIIVLTA